MPKHSRVAWQWGRKERPFVFQAGAGRTCLAAFFVMQGVRMIWRVPDGLGR